MSDYPPRDQYDQAAPAGAKYDDRARSPLPPRDSRDHRDDGPRPYNPPARPSHAPQAEPSNVLGVFGLSIRTREEDLEMEFGRVGRVEKVVIVYDQRSGRSRGFGFVTLGSVSEAQKAIDEMNGFDLHGRRLRVDFSATTRPHEPTPGEYRGPRRIEDDYRRGPPAYDSRYGDRYAGGGAGAGGGRDRYDDRRGGGYSRDDRYSSSRYGSSSSYDRYGSGAGGAGGDRYGGSSSGRRDRDDYGRSSRDDRDRDYGRDSRRRDSRSPEGSAARERSPRRERSVPRDDIKEDY
ncbi:uncharacterized protein JCM6883_004708 [Sporobolomyces salmoneus]|uniref:uncharacterized protein n=1 Tax=Sporobolomyces salmoneus TaxID=183962 RepID=UPI0031702F86